MKTLLHIVLLFGGLTLWVLISTGVRTMSVSAKKADTAALQFSPPIFTAQVDIAQQANSMTDSRDGETYATVTIGRQIWMAENLRYNASGSRLNPDNPSTAYGRLYDGITAQTACPSGWHLPSDSEWNEMEIVLGMSVAETDKTYWRGEHGTSMKSVSGWIDSGNGTNSSGFNALPAGYYSRDDWGGPNGFGGLGTSVGYWSSTGGSDWSFTKGSGSRAWLRFLGAPLKGVNRFDDDKLSGFAVACRCVKD